LTYSRELVRELGKVIRHYDVVHVHGLQSHVGSAAMSAARRHRVPYVIEPHGALDAYHWGQHRLRKRGYAWLIDRRNWGGLSGAIYSSELEANEATRILKTRAFQMPLGVDASLFDLALGGDPRRILYLGRITRKKRLDIVLGAVRNLVVRGVNLRLVIAGGSDGTLGFDATEYVQDNGMGDFVEIVGPVDRDRRLELLRDASVFVLPSEDESFGVAVAEAMAAGLVVVTTDRVGLAPDAAHAGALLLAPLNVEGLEGVLFNLLSGCEGIAEAMQKARSYAQDRFDWDRSADLAVSVYDAVVGGSQ
jgi:glycosyltransferase involved in cell wall biosynthesis